MDKFDSDLYGCEEEISILRTENKKLREQIKVAVHQGMDGAKAGYEEVIERQRERIKSLEEMLLDVLGLIWEEYGETERVKLARKVLDADWR